MLSVPDGARINVAKGAWRSAGALSFAGTAQIGALAASGESQITLAGTYEIRETSLWSDKTAVLKDGHIRRGESVTVMREGGKSAEPGIVYGHITKPTGDTPGLQIGLVSGTGNVYLNVGYLGGS